MFGNIDGDEAILKVLDNIEAAWMKCRERFCITVDGVDLIPSKTAKVSVAFNGLGSMLVQYPFSSHHNNGYSRSHLVYSFGDIKTNHYKLLMGNKGDLLPFPVVKGITISALRKKIMRRMPLRTATPSSSAMIVD